MWLWGRMQRISWTDSDSGLWGRMQRISWTDSDSGLWGRMQRISWTDSDSGLWGRMQRISWTDSDSGLWGRMQRISWTDSDSVMLCCVLNFAEASNKLELIIILNHFKQRVSALTNHLQAEYVYIYIYIYIYTIQCRTIDEISFIWSFKLLRGYY